MTVNPIVAPTDPFWATMEEIWASQRARGHTPGSAEDIAALRQEAEEEMLVVERMHEECDKQYEHHQPTRSPRS